MIGEAIKKINPNAVFVVRGGDIDTCEIEWLEGTAEISKADIKTKIAELQTEMKVVHKNLDKLYEMHNGKHPQIN